MNKCTVCHADMDAASAFCTRCGNPAGPADSAVPAAEPVVRHVVCGLCGESVEEGMTYCNHCGAELAAVASAVPAAVGRAATEPSAASAARRRDDGEERELFRKNNVSYMNMKEMAFAGFVGSLGAMVVTTRRIVFEPSKLSLSSITSLFSNKPANAAMEIAMHEVTGAEPATVLAMNIGMAVVTSAKRHVFSMGLGGGDDVNRAIELINAYKTG